ncbi:MAG TPA: hypothetical protein VGJ57_07600 [Nitrospirales bacterium]|jgi:hypothetical protein
MTGEQPANISIEDIGKGIIPPSSHPDEKTLQEKEDLENQAKQAQLESYIQDVKARGEYARKIFWLIVGWISGMFILLLLQGFGSFGFKLSDTVLIAAISGTTLNILGIFVIVANYIFRKPAL